MELAQVISLVAQHGGTLGLAIVALWMLNKTWEARVDEEHTRTEQVRQALERNTEVLSRLCARLEK
jgi:hypothetical protein